MTNEQIKEIYHQQLVYKTSTKNSSAKDRILLLERLLINIRERSTEIKKALHQDFGKSEVESDVTEIFAACYEIKSIMKNLEKWMRDKPVNRSLSFINIKPYLHYEPKGNTLIITPWNYPFQLPISHLASSIAAGNTAILKLSEFTPNTNSIIRKLISETFSTDHVAVVEGDQEITTLLLNLKFDHIHFTGSPNVGKIIMAAAAKHLSDITLELGGKSPAIIDKNIHIRKVVKNLIWAKFVNAGQTCIAPDYLIVDQSIQQSFESIMKEEIKIAFGNDPQQSPDYARIINEKQFDRLSNALQEAKNLGAEIIVGSQHDRETTYFSPTVIKNMPHTCTLMQEEIFGPLLPILYVSQVNDALSIVNKLEKPLAMYIFSNDNNYVDHVIRHTTAGSTCINDAMIQILHPNLPFGGVNNSGIGQSFGWYGFKSFSHERAIAKSQFTPLSQIFWFPYTDRTKQFVKWMKRFFN